MRTFGIWASGMAASMIAGALIAARIASPLNPIAEFEGALFGALAFVCARLWASEAIERANRDF